MVAIWTRRNVDELSLLQHADAMPFASSYDASLPWTHLDGRVRFRFARYAQPSRYDVEDFVTIRVHLAAMRSGVGHGHNSNAHPIDPLWRTRFTCTGGDGKVSMNVERMAGYIYAIDLAHDDSPSAVARPPVNSESPETPSHR